MIESRAETDIGTETGLLDEVGASALGSSDLSALLADPEATVTRRDLRRLRAKVKETRVGLNAEVADRRKQTALLSKLVGQRTCAPKQELREVKAEKKVIESRVRELE